jgi:glutathione S-transferase
VTAPSQGTRQIATAAAAATWKSRYARAPNLEMVMAITFYCGSGSPFAWKVWLALEHKQLAYEMKLLSFAAGDVKKPEFLAINPRGMVPALVEGDMRLYESNAIVEYLEDAHPERPLLPANHAARAHVRRMLAENDLYLFAAVSRLVQQTLFKPKGDGDPAEIADAKRSVGEELARFEPHAETEYLAGKDVTLADFAVYPVIALLRRVGEKQPQHAVAVPPKLSAWMKRIESLPYYERTTPPHWKAG